MTRRPLACVLAAHGVSFAGDTMTLIAVPWFVLQTTGSATRTGLAAGASVLPALFSAVVGGALVDRLGYRRTSVLADLLSGSTVALIPLLHLAGVLSFPLLLALVFLGALLDAPAKTSRTALLPDLVAAAGTTIERASSAQDVVERAARTLGAPLAGLLIAAIGPTNVLLVDAGTFAVSVLLMLASGVPAGAADETRGDYLAAIRAGLAQLAGDRVLRAVVGMVALTNLLDFAYIGVLLPVYADRQLGGARDLGLLIGASSAGAAAGAFCYGAIGHRWRRWPAYTAGFLVAGAPRMFVLALGAPFPVLLATAFAGGLAAGVLNPIISITSLERTPPQLRARVLAAITGCCYAAGPLGPLAGSALLGGLGVSGALAAVGALYLIVTLPPVRGGRWRQLDPV